MEKMTMKSIKEYVDGIYAIDPDDCGCTECIIHEYIPMRDLKTVEVWGNTVFEPEMKDIALWVAAAAGIISNNTGYDIEVMRGEDKYRIAFVEVCTDEFNERQCVKKIIIPRDMMSKDIRKEIKKHHS